ncbi:MAG: sulfide/dihydroorotate dehydrogenase-like FAD/NAD-binding protein [Candidatus Omnitrophica bacterium]|nr:sulfide/dihydroorotate dehydrogenase-like FAD/NAD-binding protein [Candidatus Omnitrophota bacterium]
MHYLKVDSPLIAKKAKPGQFVIIRLSETGERIPITIADSDPDKGTITLLVQEAGKTTTLLGRMKEGESIQDMVGPLGTPSHIDKFGKVVCVGGGFGIAAIHLIAKALKEVGNEVISIIGARSKDLLIMEDEMKNASSALKIATDDGSYGEKGFVTDILRKLLNEEKKPDLVIAVGPVPMMKAVSDMTKPSGIKTMVSLNPIMIDGTGMCGGCRVNVGGKTKFACVEGPDFDGHQVDFDLLMKRQKTYTALEKESMRTLEHGNKYCRE